MAQSGYSNRHIQFRTCDARCKALYPMQGAGLLCNQNHHGFSKCNYLRHMFSSILSGYLFGITAPLEAG